MENLKKRIVNLKKVLKRLKKVKSSLKTNAITIQQEKRVYLSSNKHINNHLRLCL